MDIRMHNFRPWVVLKNPCQHLTKNSCAVYKNRPSACKDFDGRTMFFDVDKCLWGKET